MTLLREFAALAVLLALVGLCIIEAIRRRKRRDPKNPVSPSAATTLVLYLARVLDTSLLSWVETLQEALGSRYRCALVCNDRPPSHCKSELVLWLDDQKCRDENVTNLTLWDITAWDKGFLLAEQFNYDFTWFLEDDVFVVEANIFSRVDRAFPDADLLISPEFVIEKRERKDWHWHRLFIDTAGATPSLPLPWYGTACRAQVLRASRGMMRAARKHLDRGLPHSNMIEYMWQTVAHHAGLTVSHPLEMIGLDCAQPEMSEMRASKGQRFYHSVKKGTEQDKMRQLLQP